MDKIYFDHNATMGLKPEVKDLIYNFDIRPYNASSIHHYGREAKKYLNEARHKLLSLLNVEEKYNVIFTSSGTESNLLALHNFRDRVILASSIEHPSIIKNLANSNHVMLEVDKNGEIDLINYRNKLSTLKNPGFVTIMLANNETGVLQDLKLLTQIAHEHNCVVHTDASQALGKLPFSIEEMGVDLMTISSHKIGGPGGVAGLLYRKSLKLQPLFNGGGQEYGLRSGTENIVNICGFVKSVEIMLQQLAKFVTHTGLLRDYLEAKLRKIDHNIEFFSEKVKRLANTSNFSTNGISSEIQVINFDLENIMVSAGSACSSGKVKSSYVLSSMGYEEYIANSAIRLSFGLGNNIKEIDYFVEKWQNLYFRFSGINKLQRSS